MINNIHPLCCKNCSNSCLLLSPSFVIAVPFSLKTEFDLSLASEPKIEFDLSLFAPCNAGLELSLKIPPILGEVGKIGLDTCFFIVGLYNICGLDTSLYIVPNCGLEYVVSSAIGWRYVLGLSTTISFKPCLCSCVSFSLAMLRDGKEGVNMCGVVSKKGGV